jgi:diguanylate cyclase (GGDEF)-like protein/PAS domain S-box-containing protein
MQQCGEESSAFEHEGGPEVTRLAVIFNQMLARMKESQAALRSNEELQRTLLNASPDIICFKDGEGHWLLANEAMLALFQLEGVAYLGKKDSELAPLSPLFQDALPASEVTDEQAWEHGSMLTTEETFCTPARENRIFEVIKAPLFHPDDSRKALVVIGRDISMRKKDEESIHKLSLAVEQSPVTIVITDIHGNIEFVNPAFTQLTGYTPAEAMGKNPRVLKTGKTPPETYKQLWQTISNGMKWEGEFYNKKKNGEEFVEHAVISPIFNEQGKITHYMAIKDDITARKQSEETIWHQANFDTLTGLCNRRLFHNRLENAIHHTLREKSFFVLIFLDLDHFKEVNDTLGHDYGDLLLIEAAQRLHDSVREADTVSRFGGDEFALLLTNIKIDVGIDKVTKKILDALNKPFYLKEEVAHVSASIGVTLCPDDGDDVFTLLKNADRAMYLAKNAGRNCWRSFTDVKKSDLENSIDKGREG